MRRFVAQPWLSAAVFSVWLLLAGDFGPLNLLGAFLMALVLPAVAAGFGVPAASAGRPLLALRLAVLVCVDIVKSNFAVAAIVLARPHRRQPAFVSVPVETDHPYVLNLLASIITMTPGTVSARVALGAPGTLPTILVHVLDCPDPAAVVGEIKARYETPLLEIFECSTRR